MATNIGPAGSFTTGNMKPASGEQVDALWGQNIADNTAYLRARQTPFYQYDTINYATAHAGQEFTLTHEPPVYIFRPNGHNYVSVSLTAQMTCGGGDPDVYYTIGPVLYGNLGTYTSLSTGTLFNTGSGTVIGSTFNVNLNLGSYLSEGSWGTLTVRMIGTMDDHASNGSASFVLNQPVKGHTYWG